MSARNGKRSGQRGGLSFCRKTPTPKAAQQANKAVLRRQKREVCELALAHVNTNAIEAAYRRTDLFERRRTLMEQWAAFLTGGEDDGTAS